MVRTISVCLLFALGRGGDVMMMVASLPRLLFGWHWWGMSGGEFFMPRTCEAICEVEGMEALYLRPETCELVDCFTLECETSGGQNSLVDIEDFPMVTIRIDGGDPINSEYSFILMCWDTCI
jgi:hypothetical protein